MSASNCGRKWRRDRVLYKAPKTRLRRTSPTQMHKKVVTENPKVGSNLENVRDGDGPSLSCENPRHKFVKKTEGEGRYASLYRTYLKYFLCCLTVFSALAIAVYLPVDQLFRNYGNFSFESFRTWVPLLDEYQNRFQRYLNASFQITLLTLGVLTIQLIYYIVMSRQEAHARAVEEYFYGIAKILKQRVMEASEPEERVVLLDLLLNEMIPPGQRKREAHKWNEALQVLEVFDRRIRFGVVKVSGKDVRTAEWIEDVTEDAEESDTN